MPHILIQLRQKHGYTQEALAKALSISRQHLAKIERGEADLKLAQAKTCAELFEISIDDISAGKLPTNRTTLPSAFAKASADKKEKKAKAEQEEGRDPRPQITVHPENVQKFKEVLLYVLEKVGAKPNVGKTVLFKLLYFIDFDFYEKYEEQCIGLTYQKEAYGPLPKEFTKIVRAMKKDGELQEVTGSYFDKEQIKYLPLRRADLTKLKAHELAMIEDVLRRLSDMSADEIKEYSHRDVPWKVHLMHEDISYESVFYRDDAFSVSDDDDEL